MTPEQRYQRDLAAEDVFPDPAQAQVVRHTQRIYEDLSRDGQGRGSLLRELWRRFGGRRRALRGLYLWGGVGRGKTYLVDTLFECLPFADKRRAHFHSFMQTIQGLRDLQRPLDVVAERMAKEMRVLCLDEFTWGTSPMRCCLATS